MPCDLAKGNVFWYPLMDVANRPGRFNSYTQQICIDDAVVIDEQRPENVVTNDGTTMRIMAQKNATPSAWTRQKEVVVGKQPTAVLIENAEKAKAEVALIEAELAAEAPEGQ